jgi:putative membrane protein
MKTLTSALFALLLLQACKTEDNIHPKDREFAENASFGNVAEIDLGGLAQSKDVDDSVRYFGKLMTIEHQAAQADLQKLAQDKEFYLPETLNEKHMKTKAELTGLSGHDFAVAYMTGQVQDHLSTVALFEEEVNNGKDAQAKAYAAK